jgi:hypothetical protein
MSQMREWSASASASLPSSGWRGNVVEVLTTCVGREGAQDPFEWRIGGRGARVRCDRRTGRREVTEASAGS